jgi:HK97 family phage prohead protease
MNAPDLSKPFRRLAPNSRPDVDQATGLATFIFNTEEVGRDGHIVRNSGIRTDNFARNPVILFAHDDTEPPVGRAVDIQVADPASKVTIQFTPADLNPFGDMIGRMVKARYLNAVSESWQPLKAKRRSDGDGYDFLEVDLLECSVVPIPALVSALATARAHGIDTMPMAEWAERNLDSGDRLGVDRTELLRLRRAASGRMTAFSLPIDGGRATRAVIAKELQQTEQRRQLALRIAARGASKLPAPSREALETVQQHHERCHQHAGELKRQHAHLAEHVRELAELHRRLKRAIGASDASTDHAVTSALADLGRNARDIASEHDGCEGACEDLTTSLGLASGLVNDILDGIPEM